ncbi:MAG TPA: flippase [Burkholderiales bacterium]|nr:flippase [Burkholderiales bacterium]
MSWMTLEQILRLASGLIVGIHVTRYLGPEQVGVLSYVGAFVAIFAGIAKLGADDIVVKEIVIDPNDKYRILGTAFWLKIFSTLLMIVLIAVTLLFLNVDKNTQLYIYIVAGGIFFQSFEVVDFYCQAHMLMRLVSMCRIVQIIISAILRIYLVSIGADLMDFVLLTLIDQLSIAIMLFVLYFTQENKSFIQFFDLSLSIKILKQSWPLLLSYLSYIIYARIDQVMIKNMIGEKALGYYSTAYKLYEIPQFIAFIFARNMYPLLTKKHSENIESFAQLMKSGTSIMTLISYLLVLFFWLFSDKLINILYGAQFAESSHILFGLSLCLIPIFNGCLRSAFINITNNQRILFYSTLISTLINVVLNYYLIKIYGVIGSVYAIICTQFISLLIMNLFFSKLHVLLICQLKSFLLLGLKPYVPYLSK